MENTITIMLVLLSVVGFFTLLFITFKIIAKLFGILLSVGRGPDSNQQILNISTDTQDLIDRIATEYVQDILQSSSQTRSSGKRNRR